MEEDITKTGTTSLDTELDDFSVASAKIDGAEGTGETYWYFSDFSEKLGYYLTIPEYKRAVDTFATQVLSKGFEAKDPRVRVELDHLKGWGEDNFLAIMWNMLVMKKVNGDSFAEIMRDEKTNLIINIKPLDPGRMRVVVNPKGFLKRYDYLQTGKKREFEQLKPSRVLHLVNDRIADQIHGIAASEAAKWVIDARHEVMEDLRRISHRSTIRVLYVKEEDLSRRSNLKRDYAEAIKKGELLILPGDPKVMGFQDLTMPPTQAYMDQIRYYENVFYQVVGVPRAAVGSTEGDTEASAKVGIFASEPGYTRETTDLEADLWNQLAIKVKFEEQPSMMDGLQQQEQKNNAQTGFQPNDTQVNMEGER